MPQDSKPRSEFRVYAAQGSTPAQSPSTPPASGAPTLLMGRDTWDRPIVFGWMDYLEVGQGADLKRPAPEIGLKPTIPTGRD